MCILIWPPGVKRLPHRPWCITSVRGPAMLRAIEALYAQAGEQAFVEKEIRFHPVLPGASNADADYLRDGTVAPALTVRVLRSGESDDKGRPATWSAPESRRHATDACVAEIHAVLSDARSEQRFDPRRTGAAWRYRGAGAQPCRSHAHAVGAVRRRHSRRWPPASRACSKPNRQRNCWRCSRPCCNRPTKAGCARRWRRCCWAWMPPASRGWTMTMRGAARTSCWHWAGANAGNAMARWRWCPTCAQPMPRACSRSMTVSVD